MQYEGVDMVCAMICSVGSDCLLWKLDVKSAYRHVRVNPSVSSLPKQLDID